YRPGPHYNILPVASYGAAFLAVQGALAAIRARTLTGTGRHVETSLVDGALVLNTMFWQWAEKDLPYFILRPRVKPDLFRRHLALMAILPCGDGKYIQMHSGQPGRFQRALELFGLDDRVPKVPPLEERTVMLTAEEKAFL